MKNVLTPLGKNVLIRIGLKAAASAAGAEIRKKNSWFFNGNIYKFK